MSLFKPFGRVSLDKDKQHLSSLPSAAPSSTSQNLVVPTSKGVVSADTKPPRRDGSDKYYGFENFGNTCYCNSVVQALYYTKPFREAVLNYPRNNVSLLPQLDKEASAGSLENTLATSIAEQQTVVSPASLVTTNNPRPPTPTTPKAVTKRKSNTSFVLPRVILNRGNSSTDHHDLQASASSPPVRSSSFVNGIHLGSTSPTPTNPGGTGTHSYAPSPYSLNGAIASTSILAQNMQKDPNAPPPFTSIPLDYSRNEDYGMKESLFTCLKDLFEKIVAETGKSGVVAPVRLVEVLKRSNELFQGNIHQDAHEFLNYILNDVVESVDRYEKSRSPDTSKRNSRWVHELFEGILTSETKCLTCENLTKRDEVFLDLSIDIEQNSSVSACLRQFSASEMLCERNKFHCDVCGGLQEAEKRMKIQKSPKILALHLKRFKYTEDMQRNLKLFHRVVYPPTLRMYELYAVVVHIGGGPYHGHYVTVVKNDETGKWMLIDDEAVEAVDDDFVGRFYGDRPGLASAYVLFYQQVDQKLVEPGDNVVIPNGKPEDAALSPIANSLANNELNGGGINGHGLQTVQNSHDTLSTDSLSPATLRTTTHSAPLAAVQETSSARTSISAAPSAPLINPSMSTDISRTPTKKELKEAAKREKEERKEREKREKEEAKHRDKESVGKKIGRSSIGTIKRWGGKDRDKEKS